MKSKLTVLLLATLAIGGLSTAFSQRPAASPPAAAAAFVGRWNTQWDVHYPPNPGVEAPVEIKVDTGDANALDGVVEVKGPNGVMHGTVSYNQRQVLTWQGNWWNPDGVHGSFSLSLTDQNHFAGTYKVFPQIADSDKGYNWTGTRQ